MDGNEKKGGFDRSEADMRNFRETIDACEVFDPGFTGPKFTWCNNHVNHGLIWKRLDRFLINPAMQNRCSVFKVCHLAMISSDHRPILAEWKEEPPDKRLQNHRRPKRFEEVWTKYEECREIVRRTWVGTGREGRRTLTEKMGECLSKLEQWSKGKYNGSIRGAIARKENEIQGILNQGNQSNDPEVGRLEKELEILLEDDEIYWKQRAREDWLNWGDRNTKWFHLKASCREKANRIRGMYNENGV